MGHSVTTVSTTVVVTVLMTHLVTDRLVTVKGDVNLDIPTNCATNVIYYFEQIISSSMQNI